MKEIRSGSGFGDSIYLQSIVRSVVLSGDRITARSGYPELFRSLGVPVVKFHKTPPCLVAHYAARKSAPETTQFEDMVISAGIIGPVEMRLDWQVAKPKIIGKPARPVIAVMLPRSPMSRDDGFGKELSPDYSIIDALLRERRSSITTVQIGQGEALYDYGSIDVDLANKTSISDLLDVACLVDGFVGICSFMIPLAESLDKPFFALWSAAGLESKVRYINRVTPEKIIHRKDLGHYAVDTESPHEIRAEFELFLQQVTCKESARRQARSPDRFGPGLPGQ